ncbi:lipid-transfer protein [Mycolicibacterium setense]|uniref:thiolase C-terminal domain-containing protein n=1 Tax=Mycolicibacterium setense TaxID=431269 RepID=UPI0007EB0D52|nr:lipid-transfer protein [Mycolicibacterium setense]OBB17665.1 lipid-transfer protein [Mycolicibacterium setense]
MTGCIVAGIGQTEFSKNSGRPTLRLAAEASLSAIADAGLTPADIDGLVTFIGDDCDESELIDTLGIPQVNFWARNPGYGFGTGGTVQLASAALRAGEANAVLIFRALNGRSGRRYGQPIPTKEPFERHITYGLATPAQQWSMWFRRYMVKYGVTNEDFGQYSVVARRHAATNPNAWFFEKPITIDDHQSSRWIVEPVLRLLDCCQESDGAVALVITRDERTPDTPNAVRIVDAVDTHVGKSSLVTNFYSSDPAGFPDAAACARRLFERNGFGLSDFDVAEIYENFSPLVHLTLEAYGFCKPGEATDFIRSGGLGLDGALPTNTHGGLLGEAYIHGMNTLTEAVRQVRGNAANQVPDVELALMCSMSSAVVLASA